MSRRSGGAATIHKAKRQAQRWQRCKQKGLEQSSTQPFAAYQKIGEGGKEFWVKADD